MQDIKNVTTNLEHANSDCSTSSSRFRFSWVIDVNTTIQWGLYSFDG